MLIAEGYSVGKHGTDGSFGSDTLKAVKAYQRDHGLEVDGRVGPATKAALIDEKKATNQIKEQNSESKTSADKEGASGTEVSNEPNVTRGKSRAPSTGEPGSTYEQVDDKGNVVSRTKYGNNGKPEYRQDYSHEHYSKEIGEYLQPHQHSYSYNAKGQPTGETVTRIKWEEENKWALAYVEE